MIKGLRKDIFSNESLVLRYDNRFDNIKGQKMINRWEGPLTMEVINSRTGIELFMNYV